MKYKLLFLIGIMIALAASCTQEETQEKQAFSNEATFAKTREFADLWFHHSAEMKAVYLQTYKMAHWALDKQLEKHNGSKKPAVVLDIDETVLDNSPYQFKLIETESEYTYENWTYWVNLSIAKALPGVYDFTTYAKEKGVEVFYISNRTVEHLDATIENLKKHKLPNADSAHVFLKNETGDKTARRAIVSENFEIILFLGDNLTDFSQDFAHRTKKDMAKDKIEENKKLFGEKYIIFPNPMYGEWEKAFYNDSYKWTEDQKDSLRAMVMNPGY